MPTMTDSERINEPTLPLVESKLSSNQIKNAKSFRNVLKHRAL